MSQAWSEQYETHHCFQFQLPSIALLNNDHSDGVAAVDFSFFWYMQNISVWSNCNYTVYSLVMKEKKPLIAIHMYRLDAVNAEPRQRSDLKVLMRTEVRERASYGTMPELAIVEIKTHERKIEGNEKSANYYNLLDFDRCCAGVASALSVSERNKQINEFPDLCLCVAVHRLVLTRGARALYLHAEQVYMCPDTKKQFANLVIHEIRQKQRKCV